MAPPENWRAPRPARRWRVRKRRDIAAPGSVRGPCMRRRHWFRDRFSASAISISGSRATTWNILANAAVMRSRAKKVTSAQSHLVPFDCKQNIDEAGHRFLAQPVALQLADQLHPACRFRTGLADAFQTRAMGFGRCARDGIHHRIDLVTCLQGVERREYQADLGPECRHDQLLAPRCLYGRDEVLIFPGVNSCTIERFDAGQ